jgi:predicted nucleotidyltransferase
LLMGIDEFIEQLKTSKVIERYRITEFRVFGSFARGGESNDIDILIDSENIQGLIPLKEELESLTGKSIDLVLRKYANPIILVRAEKESIRVA